MPREETTEHSNNEDLKNTFYSKLFGVSASDEEGILTSQSKIRETATHDFTAYEFLYEPLLSTEASAVLSFEEKQLLFDMIRAAVSTGIPDEFVEIGIDADHDGISPTLEMQWFRSATPGMDDDGLSRRLFTGPFQRLSLPLIIKALNDVSAANHEAWISAFAVEANERLINFFKVSIGTDFTEQQLNNRLFEEIGFWEDLIKEAIASVQIPESGSVNLKNRTRTFGRSSFTPFEPDTVNFGVQLVYRQVWIPLGTQAGEVVKTIPLGPGQTEKISIRSLRRKKTNRAFEETRETESSSESNETTRDSSEVVDQASSTFRWSTDISASASWGWGQASASASLGGDKSNSSSSTKSNLNEAMSKTADKLRVETKIKVSTESLDELERTQTSEITNKNDEVAVTYVYSKLQRQYEIHTYLAEVNTVVYVASPIPTAAEMTPAWFGKHGHILASVLMHSTFIKDLEIVLAHNPYKDDDEEVKTDEHYVSVITKVAREGLPDMSQAPGTPPDFIASAMEVYDRDKERGRANKQAQRSYEKSFDRLREHILENALYYARAFWQAKDPDMRMMEYANIRVPTQWRYQSQKINYETGEVIRAGGYVPTTSRIENMARLSDIVNPAGPIGYAGNYLVFYLRSDKKIYDLQAPLAAMRTPYLKRGLELTAPEGVNFHAVASHSYTIPKEGLDISISLEEGTDEKLEAKLTARATGKDFIRRESAVIAKDGGEIKFRMLKAILRPAENTQLTTGMRFQAKLSVLPVLEDPELRQLRWDIGPSVFETNDALFSAEVIAQMAEAFPEISVALSVHGQDSLTIWENLSAENQRLLQSWYPEFLLKQRHTRRFLLDTDNVFLTRIVDNNSSLEPFKDVHRNLDILRTVEELEQQQIETDRLAARIDSDDLSDPDIETRTVVIEKDAEVDVDV